MNIKKWPQQKIRMLSPYRQERPKANNETKTDENWILNLIKISRECLIQDCGSWKLRCFLQMTHKTEGLPWMTAFVCGWCGCFNVMKYQILFLQCLDWKEIEFPTCQNHQDDCGRIMFEHVTMVDPTEICFVEGLLWIIPLRCIWMESWVVLWVIWIFI